MSVVTAQRNLPLTLSRHCLVADQLLLIPNRQHTHHCHCRHSALIKGQFSGDHAWGMMMNDNPPPPPRFSCSGEDIHPISSLTQSPSPSITAPGLTPLPTTAFLYSQMFLSHLVAPAQCTTNMNSHHWETGIDRSPPVEFHFLLLLQYTVTDSSMYSTPVTRVNLKYHQIKKKSV